MALGFAIGSIAGEDLENAGGTPFKALIVDGANFQPTMTGANEAAADGTIFTQVLAITSGVQFGVKLEFASPSVVSAIIAAISAAMVADGFFNVTIQDDLTIIDADCVPDFAAGWIKYPTQRTNPTTVKDVEFRFITV